MNGKRNRQRRFKYKLTKYSISYMKRCELRFLRSANRKSLTAVFERAMQATPLHAAIVIVSHWLSVFEVSFGCGMCRFWAKHGNWICALIEYALMLAIDNHWPDDIEHVYAKWSYWCDTFIWIHHLGRFVFLQCVLLFYLNTVKKYLYTQWTADVSMIREFLFVVNECCKKFTFFYKNNEKYAYKKSREILIFDKSAEQNVVV